MTVSRTEVSQAQRLQSPFWAEDDAATVSRQKLASFVKKFGAKWGAAGVKAVKTAWAQARAKAGGDPTFKQVSNELGKARSSLANERAKGRINDGYVDDREAKAIGNPVADEVYAYLSGRQKVAPADANVKATKAQLAKAYGQLERVVDAGFLKFKAIQDGNYPELMKSMRAAAKDAGLPADGVAALVIATNGVTGRGDNGSLTDGGNSLPTAAEVKHALKNAQTKLANADGALIVDFAHADRAPTSKKDGVVTGLEADRTPLVQGKAVHKFLAFASGL